MRSTRLGDPDRPRRATLGLLVLVALLSALAVRPAMATDGYTRALGQPCVACHTSGTSADLGERGRAFAAVAGHEADPAAAWAMAVRAYPLEPSTGNGITGAIVPIGVLVLLLAWTYAMLRRRRAA
jgi:hypothetical protein